MRKSAGFDLKPLLIGTAVILIPLTIYILYRISNSTNRLIPISIIALIAGAIVENKRLTQKWSTVFYIAIFSFVLSFLCFLPGKRESQYVFENHIASWPYSFLMIFVIMSYAVNKDKIIPRMTEAITLIMSVCIIYWIIDQRFYNVNSLFLRGIMFLGFLIAIFSIINAFLNFKLTKSLRLFLSIWSSIIMILLALDNIHLVYQNGAVEDSAFLIDKISVGLQYFLLGICSVYILQNVMMIMGFLPDKSRFFNKDYFRDVRELKNEHINRYSENQSNILISVICLLISSGFLVFNYIYNLLPRNTAIWIVLFILNTIVYSYETLKDFNYRYSKHK